LGDALASNMGAQEWYRRRDRMRAETEGVLIEQAQMTASALSAAPGLSIDTVQLSLEQPTPNSAEPTDLTVEGQVRQLFHAALEAQTPASLVEFAEFCSRFRRHSIFNARLIQTQRRGARVCATAAEWQRAGRHILPDAQPIIILWPFGPTAHVYDVEDTGPVHDRAAIGDPFAATTALSRDKIAAAINRLVKGCAASKQFHIDIVGDRLGFSLAGSAAAQGEIPAPLPDAAAATAHGKVAATPTEHVYVDAKGTKKGHWIPSWRVKMNDRMTPAEQLVTVAHELGHIFCGHIGGCGGHLDQGGWPDRNELGFHEQEMEAEAVAWLVAQRAGVLTGSTSYLRRHVEEGQSAQVDTALVAKAAGRIESIAKLRYVKL
jgi:IrrE N-terminal-like domain